MTATLSTLAALGACGDQTGPEGMSPPPAVGLLRTDLLVAMLTDASDRIVPALPESPYRDDLAKQLVSLSTALADSSVGAVRVALASLATAISRYSGTAGDPGVVAELDAVRFATELIELQLRVRFGI